MCDYFVCFLKFSSNIPEEMRTRAITRIMGFTAFDSPGIRSSVSIVPNMGVEQLNTVILDTGLCLSSIPHKDYAIAESKAR